jgi:hypothetical protein
MIDMFLLLGPMWGYMYLKWCHSFAIPVYLNYVYAIIQVYLVIDSMRVGFLPQDGDRVQSPKRRFT